MLKFLFTAGMVIALSCLSQLQAQTQACCSGIQERAGSQEVLGPAEPQRVQGPQGPCCASAGEANISLGLYSLMDQNLDPNAQAHFELDSRTSSFFDISMAPITGEATVLKSGVYLINLGNETPSLRTFQSCEKTYVTHQQIAIGNRAILIHVDNQWFLTETIYSDATGLYIQNISPHAYPCSTLSMPCLNCSRCIYQDLTVCPYCKKST
jgi:hypothetical protein